MLGNIRNVLLLVTMIFGACLEVIVVIKIQGVISWDVLAIASLTPVLIVSTFTAIVQATWKKR